MAKLTNGRADSLAQLDGSKPVLVRIHELPLQVVQEIVCTPAGSVLVEPQQQLVVRGRLVFSQASVDLAEKATLASLQIDCKPAPALLREFLYRSRAPIDLIRDYVQIVAAGAAASALFFMTKPSINTSSAPATPAEYRTHARTSGNAPAFCAAT